MLGAAGCERAQLCTRPTSRSRERSSCSRSSRLAAAGPAAPSPWAGEMCGKVSLTIAESSAPGARSARAAMRARRARPRAGRRRRACSRAPRARARAQGRPRAVLLHGRSTAARAESKTLSSRQRRKQDSTSALAARSPRDSRSAAARARSPPTTGPLRRTVTARPRPARRTARDAASRRCGSWPGASSPKSTAEGGAGVGDDQPARRPAAADPASAPRRSSSRLVRIPSGPSSRSASSAQTGTPVSSSAISRTSASSPPVEPSAQHALQHGRLDRRALEVGVEADVPEEDP